MDSAKDIAKDMLDAINVDHSGFLGALAKGFISFPVSMGYLAYDFLDTEHRWNNQNDTYRFALLIKRVTFNKELIGKVIGVFIDDFASRVNLVLMAERVSGNIAGKVLFSKLTGINLGIMISERLVAALFSGAAIGTILAVGAEVSRAIYTSRYLAERNPSHYQKLRDRGDLDLLYFLVEDIVKPFEKAIDISNTNIDCFNEVCQCFLDGLGSLEI